MRFHQVESLSAKRATLDYFIKHYKSQEKRFEKAPPHEKFDISLQLVKKILSIKTFEMEDPTLTAVALDELNGLLEKHLEFMLLDYIYVNRLQILKESLTSESNAFDLLMVLINQPFKIKLAFYQQERLAKTLLTVMFKYL